MDDSLCAMWDFVNKRCKIKHRKEIMGEKYPLVKFDVSDYDFENCNGKSNCNKCIGYRHPDFNLAQYRKQVRDNASLRW